MYRTDQFIPFPCRETVKAKLLESSLALLFVYPLFQGVDFFGNGAVGLVDAVAVAAVCFGDFAVFQNHFHHAAVIQLLAVAGYELFHFHYSSSVTQKPRGPMIRWSLAISFMLQPKYSR